MTQGKWGSWAHADQGMIPGVGPSMFAIKRVNEVAAGNGKRRGGKNFVNGGYKGNLSGDLAVDARLSQVADNAQGYAEGEGGTKGGAKGGA